MEGDSSSNEASKGDVNQRIDNSTTIPLNSRMSRPESTADKKRRKYSDMDGDDHRTGPSKVIRESLSDSVPDDGRGHTKEASADKSGSVITVTTSGKTTTFIKTPGYRDVLLGRGRGIQTANGNFLMRQMIAGHRKKYCSLMRQDRRKYSEAVLDEVLATGARFLQRTEHDDTEYWVPVDRETAHDKVSHSLREKRPSREHNIGDPLPQGHSSSHPDDEVLKKRREPTIPPSRKQDHNLPLYHSSDPPNQTATVGTLQFGGALPQPIQQTVTPEVAATTVLLLQALQSQAQQQHVWSTMVQNISQLPHNTQPPNHSPQMDLSSQLAQLQAGSSLNQTNAMPGSFFLTPTPIAPPQQQQQQLQQQQQQHQQQQQPTLNTGLSNLLAAQQQGFIQSSVIPTTTNLNSQIPRSTHQTVVGQASLSNLPNQQTQYASSILLQALMSVNQRAATATTTPATTTTTTTTTSGLPQGDNNNVSMSNNFYLPGQEQNSGNRDGSGGGGGGGGGGFEQV